MPGHAGPAGGSDPGQVVLEGPDLLSGEERGEGGQNGVDW